MRELSTGIRAAWGLDGPRRGGPRPTLTMQRVVAAAIELADAGGLEATSMPKLAKSLDSGTMSIYRHVADRAELETLMRDAAIEALPTRPPPSEDWRATLTCYSDHFAQCYRRHPWILDVPVSGFPNTPNLLAWLDFGLTALARLELDARSCLGIMLLLDGHVASSMRIQRAPGTSGPLPSAELLTQHGLQTVRDLAMSQKARAAFEDSGLSFGVQQVLARVEELARTDRH